MPDYSTTPVVDGVVNDVSSLPDGVLPDVSLPEFSSLPDAVIPDAKLSGGVLPDVSLPDFSLTDGFRAGGEWVHFKICTNLQMKSIV